jgi:tRNA A37 threonylcarbamoyladenosine dehydratase
MNYRIQVMRIRIRKNPRKKLSIRNTGWDDENNQNLCENSVIDHVI